MVAVRPIIKNLFGAGRKMRVMVEAGYFWADFTMSEFGIYALEAGNGLLAIAPCPGQAGSYEIDLEQIHAWRPSFVISMTSLPELERLGASQFIADVPTLGARWLHFPVEDFGTPDAAQAQAWKAISDKARGALNGGGRVLVQCRGGCGRSGMVALRLMVELGESLNDALTRLRYVRHCAVETDAQFDWAAEGARRELTTE
jgi:hypothetical protein